MDPSMGNFTGGKRHGSQVDLNEMLKNIHSAQAILPRVTSYSREFEKLGYTRHFTRLWCWKTTNLEDILDMELKVFMLSKQSRWSSVY